jgi:hypothetical protein
MRVFAPFAFVVLAALLLAALFVSADAPQFSVCSDSGALLKDITITTSTPNWNANSKVYFTVAGNLDTGFDNGVVKTIADFDGIEAANKEDPLCTFEGTPFKCPEAAGAKSWVFPFAIPSVPWSGVLNSHSEFKTADGRVIFCMNLAVGL